MKSIVKSMLLMVATSLMFASCGKENIEEDILDERLVGTKWQTKDIVYEAFFGGTCFDVYEFISTTEVENYTTRNGNIDDVSGTYTYTLEYPKITIHKVNSDGEKSDLNFVFQDSRTMVREGVNEYNIYAKYIKQ